MLLDEVKIYVRSGDGGDGIIAFRREKYVPRGGPAGGDGGQGGSVILKVNPKLNTLVHFQKRVHFKAEAGERGGPSNRSGKSAQDLEIEVPPGTVVKDADSGRIIADLLHVGDRVIVAHGGRGGRGNQHFATSSNQAPRIAEKGEPGVECWLLLELRLIADVGIVGLPNAGKSTLLSVITNAKPKIADYPFTTLEPNLGVVIYDHRDLVLADIPGLIEGAHKGVGLGHAFLRHIQRTRLIVHLLDGTSEDPLADYNQINIELALYDENLGQKPQIVVFNKMDLPDAQARWPQVEKALKSKGVDAYAISAVAQINTRQLIQHIFQVMDSLPVESIKPIMQMPVYELPESQLNFTIEQEKEGVFRVRGKHIERAAAMTYWDYEEAVLRFQNILETLGISSALEKAGVQVGDTVFIGEYELEWSE